MQRVVVAMLHMRKDKSQLLTGRIIKGLPRLHCERACVIQAAKGLHQNAYQPTMRSKILSNQPDSQGLAIESTNEGPCAHDLEIGRRKSSEARGYGSIRHLGRLRMYPI